MPQCLFRLHVLSNVILISRFHQMTRLSPALALPALASPELSASSATPFLAVSSPLLTLVIDDTLYFRFLPLAAEISRSNAKKFLLLRTAAFVTRVEFSVGCRGIDARVASRVKTNYCSSNLPRCILVSFKFNRSTSELPAESTQLVRSPRSAIHSTIS